MALFSTPQEERSRSATPRSEPSLSIIAAGMRVEGELVTDGVVKIEGTVVGSVRAEQQVLVAKGGTVDGDVYTQEAILGGDVRGAIYASQRVEVQATSVVHGDIATRRIVVHEGGEVNGRVKMGDPAAISPGAEDDAPADSPQALLDDEARPPQDGPVFHT
jgi:cytoskeletal protein CcmA (bactofilin family)